MATQKLNLTRDQLATFLKNHEQIKQFERLFQLADEIAPSSDTTGISIQAGNAEAAANEALALIVSLAQDMAINSGAADQKAVQALDTLGRIANALEMLATAPVIQNNNSVVTDYIDLPEDGPHVTQARRVQWNQDDGTMDVGLYGGSVLQVGQELMYYAKNTSGGLIANGTPVMFTGTVGSSGKLTFGLAVADGSVLADYMMGVATQDIADNDFGYVTSFGLVRGFNTTGAPYGEVWADGDLLYFDPATPGTWTNVQPQAPNIDVPVAVVVNAGSGGSGSIFVRMTVAESLARLQDVYISGLANGDLLQYDSVQQRWENVPASTLPVGTATNLAGGAAGSLPYQSAPGTTVFRAIGTADQVLKVNSGATAPEWVSGAALSKVDDTNVTLTLGGSPTNALLAAASLTLGWTGQLSLARGGTNANLTAVNGGVAYSTASAIALTAAGSSGQWLKSNGAAAPTWASPAALTKVDDTNVTITLGGNPSTALLNAASITLGWTGNLAVSRGGTGTGTTFTAGSVVFAGASGIYSQDNSNYFWDNTNKRLGLGTAAPRTTLDVSGVVLSNHTFSGMGGAQAAQASVTEVIHGIWAAASSRGAWSKAAVVGSQQYIMFRNGTNSSYIEWDMLLVNAYSLDVSITYGNYGDGTTRTFVIEYSLDGGTSYTTLATTSFGGGTGTGTGTITFNSPRGARHVKVRTAWTVSATSSNLHGINNVTFTPNCDTLNFIKALG